MTDRFPVEWHDQEEFNRKVSEIGNQILEGKINAHGSVTLTASSATTVVTDRRVGNLSVVVFMPETANAAAEIPTMYVSAIAPRSSTFTITHTNNAQTDRDFKYAVLGG